MSFHFRVKDVVWSSTKCLAQVQADGISCSSLIHQCNNPVIECIYNYENMGLCMYVLVFVVLDESKTHLGPQIIHECSGILGENFQLFIKV